MADPKLQIIIEAKDKASKEIESFEKNIDKAKTSVKNIGLALGAFAVAASVGIKKAIDASNELNNSLIGLNSVARAFKQDTDAAKQAAVDLAADGLLSVKDAAASLKNLLATGFALPEAINLMNSFKDAAAFNRQGTLEFGQAIEGATQGIKNQNSIMVDNAGITKNLSIILEEAGYSVQDLGKVTSDAGVRMALYNGIVKEASVFQGDAARMSETLSGRQAQLQTQIFLTKAAIGDALAPVVKNLTEKMLDLTTKTTDWFVSMNENGGVIEYFREKVRQLLDYIEEKTGFVTILRTAFENVATVFREKMLPQLERLWEQLRPLAPFIEVLAKVFGTILYIALVAIIKIIEVTLIPIIESLSFALSVVNEGVKVAASLWDSFTTALSKVIEKIDTLIAKFKELNAVQAIKNTISSVLGFGGGKADGGPVSPKKSYIVGEEGPEMFTPGTSGRIIPNHKMGGGGTNVTVNVYGDVSGEDLVVKVGDALTQRLQLSTAIA